MYDVIVYGSYGTHTNTHTTQRELKGICRTGDLTFGSRLYLLWWNVPCSLSVYNFLFVTVRRKEMFYRNCCLLICIIQH